MKYIAPSDSTFGLFEKRFAGDDSLLILAQARFQAAAMGAEFHASAPGDLQQLLAFNPSGPCFVHLPRDFDLCEVHSQMSIASIAARFAGVVRGMVIHDCLGMQSRASDYADAARRLNSLLEAVEHGSVLHIEYAAGLDPDVFARFFDLVADCHRIGACVDIGHVGIAQARKCYAAIHPGIDVCGFKDQAIQNAIEDIQSCVETALPEVLQLVRQLGQLGTRVHFHLHDGHPLSRCSPFGVSDHLSFFTQLPISFEYRGCRHLAPMYGPAGLARIIETAVKSIREPSFTLEIHPTYQRLELGGFAPLFTHWSIKTNAELMNHWLWMLDQNHALLRDALDKCAQDIHEINLSQ